MATKKKVSQEKEVEAVKVAPEEVEPIEETAVSEKAPEPKKEHAFTKSQLIGSKKFAKNRDILSAMLKKDQMYTISECEEIIENFLKGTGD